MYNFKLSQNWVDLEKARQKIRTRLDGSSALVGRKTLKKPFLRREMAFSYTFSSYFFKQHKQHKQRKLYKRSAEKWQKVAILQKTQKSVYS